MHSDDAILIDYLAGQASAAENREIGRRLASDAEFARRHGKISGLMDLMHNCGAPEPDEDLVGRTLAAVAATPTTGALLDREALRVRPAGRSTFSLKELGAMAALLFLVATILFPAFQHAGMLSRERACVAQTGSIGAALSQYAGDHNGFLPAMADQQAAWLADASSPVRRSNSGNLWRLVHGGYARPMLFQCPAAGGGRSIDAAAMATMPDFPSREYISYSYHNSVNAKPLQMDGLGAAAGRMAILADRTPVFVSGRFDPMELDCGNSRNHNQRGQAVLFLDMHAEWTQRSDVGVKGDNIWLVQNVFNYDGTECPASDTDSFLLPSFVEVPR